MRRQSESKAQEIAKGVRRAERAKAIEAGQYGRPSQRFTDQKKNKSKRAAKGRSYRGEW